VLLNDSADDWDCTPRPCDHRSLAPGTATRVAGSARARSGGYHGDLRHRSAATLGRSFWTPGRRYTPEQSAGGNLFPGPLFRPLICLIRPIRLQLLETAELRGLQRRSC
jgi:hypothetical protein